MSFILFGSCSYFSVVFPQDVDVLQQLGLSERRAGLSSSGNRPIPNGVIPFRSGVILTPRARVQVPLDTVVPLSFSINNLSLVFSLSVHRINSAFLFSVLSKKRKLQLGVQFSPGMVSVYVGQRSSVSFDYDVHDGQWHNMAVNIHGHQVSLHTSCGNKSMYLELRSKNEEALDPEGSFLLGKLNSTIVPFEGAVCQFDIYPSAKAAQNYCDYIKKHCREADTYRPVFPPVLPLLSTDSNISVTHITPLFFTELSKAQGPTFAFTRENSRTTIHASTGRLGMLNKTLLYQDLTTMKPGTVSVSSPLYRALENPLKHPTQSVTTALKISQHHMKEAGFHFEKPQQTMDLPPSTAPSEKKLSFQTTTSSTQEISSDDDNLLQRKHLLMRPTTKPEPKPTGVQDVKPTPYFLITPPAADGFLAFDLEPTQFSLLVGPPGLKGDPGPPVSVSCLLH